MKIVIYKDLFRSLATERGAWQNETYAEPVYNDTTGAWELNCKLEECNMYINQHKINGER